MSFLVEFNLNRKIQFMILFSMNSEILTLYGYLFVEVFFNILLFDLPKYSQKTTFKLLNQ